jgi:hypothetical protein
MAITTIQIDKKLKNKLDKLKVYPRETYNELLFRVCENVSLYSSSRESLVETIEIISNPGTMRNIADSLERINKGQKFTSWEDMKKRLNLHV